MNKNPINVIIPPDYKPPKNDQNVAWILAKYYKTTVTIIKPENKFKIKTPDYFFNKAYFEMKTLNSPQVRQLLVQLTRADEQADNIVVDMRNSKIHEKRATKVCEDFLKNHKGMHILLVVTSKKVLDVSTSHVKIKS